MHPTSEKGRSPKFAFTAFFLRSSAVEGSSRLTSTSQGFQDVLGTAVLAFG